MYILNIYYMILYYIKILKGSLKISRLVKQGFLFIWCEKEYIPKLLEICEKWGFKYVENFTWIKKYVNNKIVRQPYIYFNKSKITCFIFRKVI